MRSLLEALINQQPVGQWMAAAVTKWDELATEYDLSKPDKVATAAETHQTWFEHNCGGSLVGTDIIAVSGVARFYTAAAGFSDREAQAACMLQGLKQAPPDVAEVAEFLGQLYPELEH